MDKRRLVTLSLGFLGMILWLTTSSGGSVDTETKVTPRDAITVSGSPSHSPIPSDGIIGPAEEIRGVLGTPGKNIVASWTGDGDTVQVVYGQPSGNVDEPMLLWYAQSFDGGTGWTNSSSSIATQRARRLYPGIEQLTGDTLRVPYIAWHEGRFSGGAYTRHPLYWTHDELFPFMLFSPACFDTADSAAIHFWFPSMEVSEYGDTIVISAANINQSGSPTEHNAYVWISTDGGVSWTDKILMVDTQGAGKIDIDSPLIRKGPGGYVFGYFEWAENPADTNFLPFYTESFDCGATWSPPESIGVPYDSATGWWYSYDVLLDETDGYRPHIAIKLNPGSYEFSEVWEVHPNSGSMGSWSGWQYTLLVGDQYGGERTATQPSIGRQRGTGNIYVTFSYFSDPGVQLDIGMRCSADRGQTWDPTLYQITNDAVNEEAVELAYEVSNRLHIIYLNDRDAPTQVMHLRYPNPLIGVEEKEEARAQMPEARLFQNEPNPFCSATRISCQLPQTSDISIRVYDLSGKLVRTLVDGKREAGLYTTTWDGRIEAGSEAPAGVYFYRLSSGSYSEMKKMVVVR